MTLAVEGVVVVVVIAITILPILYILRVVYVLVLALVLVPVPKSITVNTCMVFQESRLFGIKKADYLVSRKQTIWFQESRLFVMGANGLRGLHH